ncbi:MAG: hypothetical protein V4496_06555 [Pseudomonadota bacterium]
MLSRIMPFIGLGMLIVLLVYTLIFLSYVFIIGTIIGLILYIIAAIRLRWLNWESSKN